MATNYLPYQLLLLGLPLFAVAFLVRRKFRLYSIPGPFLASYTDLWRWYHQNASSFLPVLADLHQKYGPVVRVGPNTVSFSDAAAVAQIYTSHGEFRKADSYSPLRAAVNGEVKGSVIDLQDEDTVSQLRRTVGSAFATKNILDYEGDVDDTARLLLGRMRALKSFDMFAMMGRFQADFLLQIAFSEQGHYLVSDGNSEALSFDGRYRHWMNWQAMPYLEQIVYKPPVLIRYLKAKAIIPLWAMIADAKLHARLSGAEKPTGRPDLLTKYINGGEKRGDQLPVEVIPRMVSSTISAGFDTTAFTMACMVYYLCRTPSAMRTLRAELESANLSKPPQYCETEQLKYLGAVMKEAMRLYPFLQLLMEREVPDGGATLQGKFIPAGTFVGCHPSISHRDKKFYGEDAEEFKPERWLIDDQAKLLAMERASLGFGNGKRICLGKHLAGMEIKKVMSAMLLEFDMELIDPHHVLEPRDHLTSYPKPVMVRVTERMH